MTAVSILPADLAPFATIDEAKAQAMIDDALALAKLVAPCIVDDDFAHPDAAKAIIRGAILRWNDAGSGGKATVADTMGPFQHSESYQSSQRRNLFWPSEIDQLEKLCSGASNKIWSYDTVSCRTRHADMCSLTFGATYCSCGADLTGSEPLWENQ